MKGYIILLALVLLLSTATVYSKCYTPEPFYPIREYGYPDPYLGTDIQITDTTENVGFGTSRVRQIRRLPSYNPYYWYDNWQGVQNSATVSIQDMLNKINPNVVIAGIFLIVIAIVVNKNREMPEIEQ